MAGAGSLELLAWLSLRGAEYAELVPADPSAVGARYAPNSEGYSPPLVLVLVLPSPTLLSSKRRKRSTPGQPFCRR